MKLTHLNEKGYPKIVDVSNKSQTQREATASGIISMNKDAYEMIIQKRAKKGPVLQTAVIAAIMGAKKTCEIIPMCHSLHLNSISCDIEEMGQSCSFKLIVTAKTDAKTGVEMEALAGVSIGLLTIYDMIKAVDKSMVISQIYLERKSGGKSGEYIRQH
ncbi:MAG: cyclic pyranopterin monophosphate synthase MoaC [Campylobacteraceae bacterium]|nr:cyclic pyranopterin monophosphate synthase MoaC [Campylobacteraceae bacterium]